jgi:hypothetical protein
VLIFETETDLIILRYLSDRQPDSKLIRLWEVAGTAHADTYTIVVGPTDTGNSSAAGALLLVSSPVPGIINCGSPINSGPQHFVLDAAVAALNRWVRRGAAPPHAPRLDIVRAPLPAIARDPFGNAVGGIRTPELDVPIATYSGLGQTGSSFCFIFGTTRPFDAATLARLYPDHATYVTKVTRAARRAASARFLRRPDAKLIEAAASASDVGN